MQSLQSSFFFNCDAAGKKKKFFIFYFPFIIWLFGLSDS